MLNVHNLNLLVLRWSKNDSYFTCISSYLHSVGKWSTIIYWTFDGMGGDKKEICMTLYKNVQKKLEEDNRFSAFAKSKSFAILFF